MMAVSRPKRLPQGPSLVTSRHDELNLDRACRHAPPPCSWV